MNVVSHHDDGTAGRWNDGCGNGLVINNLLFVYSGTFHSDVALGMGLFDWRLIFAREYRCSTWFHMQSPCRTGGTKSAPFFFSCCLVGKHRGQHFRPGLFSTAATKRQNKPLRN
jgi:hypothetical protein